jgi:hypothetical protein
MALLNAALNAASGATWASIHHGGGIGLSQHAGMAIERDGSAAAARRLEHRADQRPCMGRHVPGGCRLRRRHRSRPRARAEASMLRARPRIWSPIAPARAHRLKLPRPGDPA